MKKNKLMLAAAVVAGGFFAFATQTTAHASAYVRSYQNIKNANATVTNTKAPVWTTASLKHRAGTMRNYGTQVEQYYAAHIRKSNGKAYIYYKFRIGKKTGWVWHGYLKPFTSGTTAPTTGTTGTSTNSGTDLVPVANANWNKIGATGAFAADSTLMQMFPNTIFSKYLYSAVQGYNNIDDGVDRP
ncbi:hypothetical protein GM612_09125, partial [Lactobacillus sp. CRM56-3]|nr:hypothetical protein [Secundilactobacillus folii]